MKSRTIKEITIITVTVALLPLYARGDERRPPETDAELIMVMERLLNYLFTFLLILAVAFIIISAYRYATSQGNPEAIKTANKTLIYALVAVAVGVLAKSFIEVVRFMLTV
jgi:hypothetical protein